ncbi:unnamed protein product [Pocillopora meandrina]|uniref:Uncharacterized protein n=1 Tax=Pocillopora meandrina TaxID=46732 RepID=A0AAU9Y0C0_9CNID|nr:unnamed protein product [Pocillopora meandrina]CAH3168772.1 unnamed protein product [Pocillopora meandrina]
MGDTITQNVTCLVSTSFISEETVLRWLEDLLSRTSGQSCSWLKTTTMSRKEIEKKIGNER